MTGARLCAWADARRAWRCCRTTARGTPSGTSPNSRRSSRSSAPHAIPGTLDVMDSGMLRAEEIAARRLRRHAACERVRRLTDSCPARTARSRPASSGARRTPAPISRGERAAGGGRTRPTRSTRSVPTALRRWAAERAVDRDSRRRVHRRTLPVRWHDVQQHGPAARVSLSGDARSPRRGISDSRAGVHAGARRRRAHS